MTIPANITAQIAALSAATQAAAPLKSATRLAIANIQAQAGALVSSIDAAVLAAAGTLDGPDPSGMPAVIVAEFTALVVSAQNQTDLADMRGVVGRAAANLNQVTP